MNLRDLRYLVALAEHKHFGRAAEASFVSQPTLSTQIRKLEDELGVALVERTPRKVLLTEVGREIVAARARRAQRSRADHGRSRGARSIRNRARVRLGIFPTLGPYLLPHVVPQHPRRAFRAWNCCWSRRRPKSCCGSCAKAASTPACSRCRCTTTSCTSEFLFEEPFVLAVPERPSRWRERKSLKLDDLVRPDACCCSRTATACAIRRSRSASSPAPSEKTGFRATSLETLRQMVAANVGITLLPTLAVKPPVRAFGRHPSGRIPRPRAEPAHRDGLAQEFGDGAVPEAAGRAVRAVARAARSALGVGESRTARRSRSTPARRARASAIGRRR